MASGNRKTTMAKLNRERRLRERRLDKQAKKDARKHMSSHQDEQAGEVPSGGDDQPSSAAPDGAPPSTPLT